jgi:4-hydroxy-tetrahydrodipicolinate synthase
MTDRDLTCWVPSLTPFTRDGDIDEALLRAHVRRLARAGLVVLTANEGNGEAQAMTISEMRRVMEIAKEEVKGTTPVWGMGKMVRRASEQIEFARAVQDLGLDGIHIYALDMGHAMKPTEREQETYLTDVLDTIDIPVMLSIHPYAGYIYPVSLVRRLADRYPNLLYALVTVRELDYHVQLLDTVGDRLKIISGPTTALSLLALGCDGFAAQHANLIPRTCASLIEHYRAGRYREAEAAFATMTRLNPIVNREGGGYTSGTKAALAHMGLPAGYPRKPRLPIDERELAPMIELLDRLRIRELEGIAVAS